MFPLHVEGKRAGNHMAVLGMWPIQMLTGCLPASRGGLSGC